MEEIDNFSAELGAGRQRNYQHSLEARSAMLAMLAAGYILCASRCRGVSHDTLHGMGYKETLD